jgi:hypothetical protein
MIDSGFWVAWIWRNTFSALVLEIPIPAGDVVFFEQTFFRFACAADPLLTVG